ncbi:MAG: hypothetical protein E6J87_12220 [Deltaproteobacteria bacterium]|nr:MAG: hypothetical protein E6J87_12220 [Deltaproteobacteria bacterium]
MVRVLDWNATRFDPGSPDGHVESHFLKLNDACGERALWLKATILQRLGETAVAEAWAVAFDRAHGHTAAKQVVPWASASFSRDALAIRVAEVEIGPMRTRGAVFTADARIEWDLAFAGSAAPFAPLPERLYADDTGNSKIVSPHPDLRFDGHYCVGEGRVDVSGWRGMQGHNWGRRHTHLYGWMHCNVWDGVDDLVVEGITARVKLGPVLSPPLTLVIAEHAGARHLFTLPGSLFRARGRIAPRAWEFRAANASARISGSFAADTEDFVGLHYENPDRAMTYCLNSKIARGEIRLEAAGRTIAAHTRAAALEIGTRDPAHGVKMLA